MSSTGGKWAAAGTTGNVLSASSGTPVAVQTVCVVVQHSSDTLRHAKSLIVAANHAFDDDQGRRGSRMFAGEGSRPALPALGYVPQYDPEAVTAVIPTSAPASATGRADVAPVTPGPSVAPADVNPELYFPFHCLVRPAPEEEFDEAAFMAAMNDNRLKNRRAAPDMAESLDLPPLASEAHKEACVSETLVRHSLSGINSTLLAVGGSGTGKAERMFHPTDGIVPRTVGALFDAIDAAAAKDKAAFRRINRTVTVSMLEFFAEEIADLLTVPARQEDLTPPAPKTVVEPPAPVVVEPTSNTSAATNETTPSHRPNMERSDTAVSDRSELLATQTSPAARAKRTVSFSQTLVSIVESTDENPMADALDLGEPPRFDLGDMRRFVSGQAVNPQSVGLRLRQHPELGPTVEGAQELQVLSLNDFLGVVRGGIARRVSSAVKTNRFAHVVVKVTLRQAEVGAAAALTSDLVFVDTATAIRVPSSIPQAKKVQQGTNALRKMMANLSEHCSKQASKIPVATLGVPTRGDDVAVASIKDVLREKNCSPNVGPTAPLLPALPNTAQPAATTLLAKDSIFTQYISDSFFGNTFLTVVGFVLDPDSLDEATNLTSAAEDEGAQQTFSTLKLVSRAGAIATRVTPNYVAVNAKTTAIKDEIDALKRELEADVASGASRNEETVAKLQSYEEQLSNIQSTFEAKATSHAELEAACQRQRAALQLVQEQLVTRRQQAEELEAFAEELDRLMEEHRLNERRLRREESLARDREREASRLRDEIQRLATETQELTAERQRMDEERDAQRQRNVAAFFRSLLEHEKQKREIESMIAQNRQWKTKCALTQAKLDKSERQRKSIVDDIETTRELLTVLLKKQYDLETDQSAEIADRQMASIIELTQRLQGKAAYTREDVKDIDAALQTEKKALQELQTGASLTIRAEVEKLQELHTQHASAARSIETETATRDSLASQRRDAQAKLSDTIHLVEERARKIDDLDERRRTYSEEAAQARKDRDVVQDEVAILTAKLEALQADIATHRTLLKSTKSRYFDLCDSAAGRLATDAATGGATRL